MICEVIRSLLPEVRVPPAVIGREPRKLDRARRVTKSFLAVQLAELGGHVRVVPLDLLQPRGRGRKFSKLPAHALHLDDVVGDRPRVLPLRVGIELRMLLVGLDPLRQGARGFVRVAPGSNKALPRVAMPPRDNGQTTPVATTGLFRPPPDGRA